MASRLPCMADSVDPNEECLQEILGLFWEIFLLSLALNPREVRLVEALEEFHQNSRWP
jgi:hypothetical protein